MPLLRRETSASIEDVSEIPSRSILVEGTRATLALEQIWRLRKKQIYPGEGFFIAGVTYLDEDSNECCSKLATGPEVTVVADEPDPTLSGLRLVRVHFNPPLIDLDTKLPKSVGEVPRRQLDPEFDQPIADEPQQFASVKNGTERYEFPVAFCEGHHAVLPVSLGSLNGRNYWIFRSVVYSTVEDLDSVDVRALALERENKVKAQVARALALADEIDVIERADAIEQGGRGPIPPDVMSFVWKRDQGRCVRCQQRAELEFSHIIPVTMGGSNSARNLQLLCQCCSRVEVGSLN